MTERKRKLGIRERSCGLQSPPLRRDCIINLNSYLRSDKETQKVRNPLKAKNHKGIGVGLRAAHGRSPKSFIAPINAPPRVFKIQSGSDVWIT